ncbi:unnamed protein product [Gadus morhua 'NCC']
MWQSWRLETHRLSTGLDRAAAGDSVGTRPYIQRGPLGLPPSPRPRHVTRADVPPAWRGRVPPSVTGITQGLLQSVRPLIRDEEVSRVATPGNVTSHQGVSRPPAWPFTHRVTRQPPPLSPAVPKPPLHNPSFPLPKS